MAEGLKGDKAICVCMFICMHAQTQPKSHTADICCKVLSRQHEL